MKQKEKLSFKIIVFTVLNKILELSSEEFKKGYWEEKIKGNYTEKVYHSDSRKKISQVIEFFSFLLQPKYDEDMKKKSKIIKEKVVELKKKLEKKEINSNTFRSKKLDLMKELFEELNYYLERIHYLKGEVLVDSEEKDYDNEGVDVA